MASLTRAHTFELARSVLDELRSFLDDAYDGDFSDDDWEHALGGVHLVLRDDGRALVGHAAVVQRRLVQAGVGIRTGYVEAVAVRADCRQQGHGGVLMAGAEIVIHGAYDLGALSAGERARHLYERRGWLAWTGQTWVLGPDGPRRTADEDGGVLVLLTDTSPELELAGSIACDWRPGDVW